MLSITKCDLLDEELTQEIKKELPADVKSLFISSISQIGIVELKDMIWKMIHDGMDG